MTQHIQSLSPNLLLGIAVIVWVVALAAIFFAWWLRWELREADRRRSLDKEALRLHNIKAQHYRSSRNTRACARHYEAEINRIESQMMDIRCAGFVRRVFRLY